MGDGPRVAVTQLFYLWRLFRSVDGWGRSSTFRRNMQEALGFAAWLLTLQALGTAVVRLDRPVARRLLRRQCAADVRPCCQTTLPWV